MITNVGNADRIARALLGLAIIAAGLYYQSWWGALGTLPLLTSALRWCPAYLPFKINTCKAESSCCGTDGAATEAGSNPE